MEIAILGAGLTGLELGRNLKVSGKAFIIFEKELEIGGLCRTNKTSEYCWDFGVHAMYSRNKEITNYFNSLPLDYKHHNRKVRVFHTARNGKRYKLDYPFEIGVKDMPLNDKLECILGYLATQISNKKNYANLEEWIYNRLGRGIAKHFMMPYNNKIWNCPLSEISNKLAASKIEPASAIDFILNALGKKTIGRAYQAKFLYPKQGIQKLVDYTAGDIRDKIMLNSEVTKLSKDNTGWTVVTANGIKIKADIVVSTIPLVELLKKINIDGLEKEYNALRWNNTFFVMVGLKKGYNFRFIENCHWVFFKENESFYRITLMHNFSSEFPPALVAEITEKSSILDKNEEEIKKFVVDDLLRLGIVVSKDQIALTDIKLLKYTYPIPTIGLEDIKERIANILREHNLFLLGRNGNWDYINMDGVILTVQNFVTKNVIICQKPEKEIWS